MFVERGLLPGPGVVDYIMEQKDPRAFATDMFAVMKIGQGQFIVNVSDLQSMQAGGIALSGREKRVPEIITTDHYPSFLQGPRVKVLKDYAESSTSSGDVNAFLNYFRSRHKKMRSFLPASSVPIVHIREGMEVSVTGMISKVSTGKKPGSKRFDIEDETGTISVYVNPERLRLAAEPLTDEVVHVRGKTSNGNNGQDLTIWADSVIWPEASLRAPARRPVGESVVAFISDLHVGSKTFLPHAWSRFVGWLNGNDERAKRVRTIVICGDNVDGIGIYPGQEEDLLIPDIHEQYRYLVEILSEIRGDISVVVLPGNHDATRPGEPQAALPGEFQAMFKDKRFIFTGNPSLLSIEGLVVLAYHGRSMDDLISCIHGLSYSEPGRAMVEMLRRRHLVPVYGASTPIYPSSEDQLVIDTVPHVLLTGHVHSVNVSEYRGIKLINASTWQSQTEYQKMRNFQPVPARVPILDLAEMKPSLLDFSK
jgi:DNA polymerase II small subunit